MKRQDTIEQMEEDGERINKNRIFGFVVLGLVILMLGFYGFAYWQDGKIKSSLVTMVKGRQKIDFGEFLLVEYTGYNHKGKVKANIDVDGLVTRYGSYLQYVEQEGWDTLSLGKSPIEYLVNNVEVVLSQAEDLANGDEFTYQVILLNDCEKMLDCDFSGKEGTYTVDQLKDGTLLDPYENLTVSFSGTSPCGYLQVEDHNESAVQWATNYVADRSEGLCLGDVITLTCQVEEEKLLESSGFYVETLEKQYVVEGIPSYVSSYEELTEADVLLFYQDTVGVVSSNIIESGVFGTTIPSLEYSGFIFRELQDIQGTNQRKNALVVVYQTKFKVDKKEVTLYFPVCFYNLVQDKDVIKYSTSRYIGITMLGEKIYPGYFSMQELYEGIYSEGYEYTYGGSCSVLSEERELLSE